MSRFGFVIAIITAGISGAVLAQSPNPGSTTMTATAPGKAVAANVVEVTASVQHIDKADRTVTVKGPQGNLLTVAAGPEVKNFDQIKVGDNVALRYVEALSLELKKGGTAPVARTEREMAAVAKPGEKPAAGMGRQIHVTADVIAVDAATQKVTLRGPQRTVELKVRDPEQFKLVKVGDQVEATYTEAVALAVEPVASTK